MNQLDPMSISTDALDLSLICGITELASKPGWILTISETPPVSPYTAILAPTMIIPTPCDECPNPRLVFAIDEESLEILRIIILTLHPQSIPRDSEIPS